MSRRLVVIALPLLALPDCNCDEVLGAQSAEAELHAGADAAPPLPQLEVSLGAVEVGSVARTTIRLESVGNLPLTVTSALLGAHPTLCPVASSEYRLGAAPPPSLGGGEGADLDVTFTPATGAPSCTVLSVATNDETHPLLLALIRGQGDAGGLCTDRPIVDFGDVLVGTTASDTATLTSCGTRPVTVLGLAPNGFFPPFAFDDVAATSVTLAPGQALSVPVRFSPTVPVRHSIENANAGLLTVTTDLVGQFFQIALVGTGKTPPQCAIDVVPAVLNFGYVPASSTQTQNVIARNIGELPCTIADIALRDGVDEFSFSAPGFTPGATLAPLSSLTVAVTVLAPAAEGAVDNALVITSDDPDEATITVPLQAAVPSDSGCFVNAVPAFVDFGAVALNTLRAREVLVTNVGGDPCFIDETRIGAGSDPGFIDTSSDFGLIAGGASKTLTVGFRPTLPGAADGTFEIDVSDQPLFGTTTTQSVALSAFTADPGICVAPRHLDYGNVTAAAQQSFRVSACGAATIDVTALDFTTPDAELVVINNGGVPRTLSPGQGFDVVVEYRPVDAGGDTAVLTVRSTDLVAPAIPVTLTGGHTIVPPEAGRFLYFWQIPNSVTGGDVMKVPLQGATTPVSFWGPRSGKQCAGCHSVSPDGKYIAVVEVGFMRFIEAESNLELSIDGTQFLDPTSFSWRPNVNTTPAYQFAYSDGQDVRLGTLFDGEIGPLAGANDGTLIDTMPSWGSDGRIAFVRGASAQTTSDGSFGLQGPTDILLVDEDGGAPVPIAGAAQNGMANYYPAYAPNGLWIAFTQSPSATSTIAATDARLRLAPADNSGAVLTLDNINTTSGPSSYTTWSVDGRFLSFSSDRSGGAGSWDIYLAPIDPLSGVDGAPTALSEVNTADFEHAAQWSP